MRTAITSARTTELRKGNRYRLNAPVQFFWAPPNGLPQSGQGVTRDINATGVYVQVNVFPPVGSRIQMDILLPKLANAGHGMHLNGEGIVVRAVRWSRLFGQFSAILKWTSAHLFSSSQPF